MFYRNGDLQSKSPGAVDDRPDAWAWVDPSHQFARIPIQQAIDLAVEHGLAGRPSRNTAIAPSSCHPPAAPARTRRVSHEIVQL